jgi:hypothetical protein
MNYHKLIRKEYIYKEVSSKSSCDCCDNTDTKIKKFTSNKNKDINLCKLCEMIVCYKTNIYHMSKCFMMESELSQEEIIQKTMKYYKKNQEILLPNKIDKNVKLLDKSHYELFNNIKKNTEINNKIKFFFSNRINIIIPQDTMNFNSLFGTNNNDTENIEKKQSKSKYHDLDFFSKF